jgi:hypothetical protein
MKLRYEHCAHLNQKWCDCDWCRLVRQEERETAMARKEFAIWGIPDGHADETLLLSTPQGQPITNMEEAKNLAAIIAEQYGATKIRIQTIALDEKLDWLKLVGLKTT